MANKNILLIEPGYKNKYPPLGLMKLASYHGKNGKQDHVTFVKGEETDVSGVVWDRIYVTTLFSFEYEKISKSIDFAIAAANGQRDKVFVGGIAASLMPDRFEDEQRWYGVRIIRGLLKDSPAKSLQLDRFSGELYSDDVDGTPIEELVPDYSILEQIAYEYPVRDAYFAYASRGCIRKCSFCGVPKLEGELRETESITGIVNEITRLYGPKKDLILMDNNIVASPKFKEIIAEIRDLGFVPGAKISRGRSSAFRRVDFNQGVDARILCKDPMYLRELATIAIRPLRIAFDHLGLKGPYEQSIRYAHDVGLNDLSNYMLYNFHDDPSDLYERMRLNVTLNEELGIRIYSFPMRFQPTNLPARSHIGEKWNRYQLRSMQIILQATHGVVSGEPSFFKHAFGNTSEEFVEILSMPHHYIFNREWYQERGGRNEFNAYRKCWISLSGSQRHEIIQLLSSCDPRDFHKLTTATTDPQLQSILSFYVPLDRSQQLAIWAEQSSMRDIDCSLAADEFVEDAGLEESDELPEVLATA